MASVPGGPLKITDGGAVGFVAGGEDGDESGRQEDRNVIGESGGEFWWL